MTLAKNLAARATMPAILSPLQSMEQMMAGDVTAELFADE
jgi:hypothetical protein